MSWVSPLALHGSRSGNQRVPGMAILHCNVSVYGNSYLISFKVRPLRARTRTHTQDPCMLPLLEAPAEGFSWNLPEFGRHIRFDGLHGCETCPLEANFQSREQPEVARSEIRTQEEMCGDAETALIFKSSDGQSRLNASLADTSFLLQSRDGHGISCRTFLSLLPFSMSKASRNIPRPAANCGLLLCSIAANTLQARQLF
jgi:hypothetical protein